MKKYGFIYLWYDTKRRQYYVGRHWGTEDDGYICSSNIMRDAHRRRPQDFKRRVISKVYTKEEVVLEEQRWLNMIKKEELGIRYYNKSLKSNAPSMLGRKHSDETKEKISRSQRGKIISEHSKQKRLKTIANMSQDQKDLWQNKQRMKMFGKKHSEETKQKMSLSHKGKPKSPESVMKSATSKIGQKRTIEQKKRMSLAQIGTKKPWVVGRTYIKNPEATKEKMRAAALLREKSKRELRLNK